MRTILLYSSKVEYRESKKAIKEEMLIWHVLTELGLVHKYPTELRCDNQSAIHLTHSLKYHSKTKIIDLDTHYIWDIVADGVICLKYCHT